MPRSGGGEAGRAAGTGGAGDAAGPAAARRAGCRMPAEWEPHASTWLAWPHNPDTWPEDLARVRRTWVEMIRALAGGERVDLLVNDAGAEVEAAAELRRGGVDTDRVAFHRIPTVDVWIRDYGPTFITRAGSLALVNWHFNAWGMKYPEYAADDVVPLRINESLGLPGLTPGIVLEGGSIEVNGAGLCLATESCLLNPNRNRGCGREEIEARLRAALGVRRILWLPAGMAGDDTDGHIDNLARFVDAATVVCVVEQDPRDVNYRALQENRRCLGLATDARGRRLRVVPLPQPGPVTAGGLRLPASYANFFIANGVVLVPLFGGPEDGAALETLAGLFPGRRVAGIDARALILGRGGIHCVTQQQPVTGCGP